MCICNYRYLMAIEDDKCAGEVYRGPVERLWRGLLAFVRLD